MDTNNASNAVIFAEDDVFKWSKKIGETLHSGRVRFLKNVLRRYVGYDLLPAIVSIAAVILVWWASGFGPIESDNADNLHMSVFQGFSAIVALIFAFVAFTYARGEGLARALFEKAIKEIGGRFNNVEIHDEAELRIWLHLWNRVRNDIDDGAREEIHLEQATNTLGRALYENGIMNSLPIRTVLVLSPFAFLMITALLSLTETLTGTFVTAVIVLGSIFSLVWFVSYAWRVLSSINRRSYELAKRHTCLSRDEKALIQKEFKFNIDEIKSDDIIPFIKPDSPKRTRDNVVQSQS